MCKSGPKTPEGKAVASRNATTHGLFSRQAVLPHLGEDAEGYRQLLDALTEQFDPRTLMERQYLELWAEASWKLRRLSRWEAQLWEQDGLDEDARLTKLERVMRLQTTLRRQLDKAVRMLGQDVPDVQGRYARRAVLASRGLTETCCREDPRVAASVEAAAQSEILCAPGLPGLDRSRLDAAAASETGTTPPAAAHENCQNEPVPPDDTEICQNEPAEPPATPAPTPPELGAGGPPNLPFRGDRVEQGRKVSSTQNCQNELLREAAEGRNGAAAREQGNGTNAESEKCQNEPLPAPSHSSCEAPTALCDRPLSLSSGGGVPDEGGVGAS